LSKGGRFIFTDPMQSESCPPDVLQPILDRIHLDTLGSIPTYRRIAISVGFEEVEVLDLSEHLPTHYARVREEIDPNYSTLLETCTEEYLERMKVGLQHWVDAGNAGHLSWGILSYRKP
jgi:sarcosine/dimethylglycine N-methyltransferase